MTKSASHSAQKNNQEVKITTFLNQHSPAKWVASKQPIKMSKLNRIGSKSNAQPFPSHQSMTNFYQSNSLMKQTTDFQSHDRNSADMFVQRPVQFVPFV